MFKHSPRRGILIIIECCARDHIISAVRSGHRLKTSQVVELMFRYYVSKRSGGEYDLVVILDPDDVEFALDFLSRGGDPGRHSGFLSFLSEKSRKGRIRMVKVFLSGILIASIPFSMFTQVYAQSHPELSSYTQGIALNAAILSDTKFNMTYLYGGTVEQQIAKVQAAGSFQTVSPSYFDIDSSGKLVLNNVSTRLITAMHEMGIKVVPMLSNHWDRKGGQLALRDPAALARQIAAYVEQYNLDGVNVDIENVTAAERDAYTLLVKTLREEIPAEKEVSVAVAANPNGWTTGWHGSYDYAALAEYADYLMIMAYDESWQGSDPGPVASLSFAERSVRYALQHAPADKIVLGIPFYGRLWSADGTFNGNGIGLNVLANMLRDYRAEITFSEEHQSPVATFTVRSGDPSYTVNGKKLTPGTYTVWFENEQSLAAKADLIHRYDLKGLGSWALNQATDSILASMKHWLTTPEDGELRYGTVTADSLRVRRGPTTQSDTIAYYQAGDRVTIVGEADGWYRVKLPDGTYGYVSADYILLEEEEEEAPVTETAAYSSGDRVRVRALPSTEGDILAHLMFGDPVTVIGEELDGWYHVRLADGTLGYVSGSYISFTQPVRERTAYSSGSNVRVRAQTSTSSAILAHLAFGESFTALGDAEGDWYRVRLADGTQGYVHADYVSFTKPVLERPGYITGNSVRIRSAGSTNASVLTLMNRGDALTVLGELQNGWYQVRLADGRTGYVHGDYISFTKPPVNRTGYSAGNDVRVRRSASTSSAILTLLKRGQSFTVTGETATGWYQVRLSNGVQGYVHGSLVTFQK